MDPPGMRGRKLAPKINFFLLKLYSFVKGVGVDASGHLEESVLSSCGVGSNCCHACQQEPLPSQAPAQEFWGSSWRGLVMGRMGVGGADFGENHFILMY